MFIVFMKAQDHINKLMNITTLAHTLMCTASTKTVDRTQTSSAHITTLAHTLMCTASTKTVGRTQTSSAHITTLAHT